MVEGAMTQLNIEMLRKNLKLNFDHKYSTTVFIDSCNENVGALRYLAEFSVTWQYETQNVVVPR